MKLTPRVRRFAAVLVVVFVLTTVWALYYLYSNDNPANGGSPQTAVASYQQSSTAGFAASLRPSYLYNNSTEVYGGNLTLFTPITNWINTSIDYTLSTNRTAAISISDVFEVTLSTPVWSKTLFTVANATSSPETTIIALGFQYDVNVSAVVALANAINTQLGYQGGLYTVSLDPSITASVSVGSVQQSLVQEPLLNFTFQQSLISPSGLSYASTGALYSPNPAAPGALPSAVPYLALIGSVGGLGSSAWVATRRTGAEGLPPLAELTAPYEEAIVATARAPLSAVTTPVASFGDLVKIADTLGKPILQPAAADAAHPTFFVMDGPIAYAYEYPGVDGVKASMASVESSRGRPFGREWTPAAAALVQRLQQEVVRLHDLGLDPQTAYEARRRIRRAVDLIHVGLDIEATEEVDQLSRFLTAEGARARVTR